jgi:hypothetical protein
MLFRYRLRDNQCDRYMALGYNARNLKEVIEDYKDYKSNDWEEINEDGEEDMFKIWDKMSLREKLSFIGEDGFTIERKFIFKFEER